MKAIKKLRYPHDKTRSSKRRRKADPPRVKPPKMYSYAMPNASPRYPGCSNPFKGKNRNQRQGLKMAFARFHTASRWY